MPASQDTVKCATCEKYFKPQGISSYQVACRAKAEEIQKHSAYAANLKERKREEAYARLMQHKQREPLPESPPGSSSYHSENSDEEELLPLEPEALPEINHFAQDLILKMLNKKMTKTLLSLIRQCGENIKEFTITTQTELEKLWGLASHKCTEVKSFDLSTASRPNNLCLKFIEDSIVVPYKKENRTFKTFTHPLWEWALSLVQDPRLASVFVWDAEKAYKFNGDAYIHFYHEPWKANAFWEAQIRSALPNHQAAKVLGFIIYVDKSKLSTFGTEKAYAVVARVANIPVSIRNSNTQFGGGQVVGHQPVVKEDTNKNNKPAFSNFKTIVWHAVFWKLLESLVHHAKLGSWTTCEDEILRWLWPIVLILTSDYEEAWNVFWKINSDPHQALSFDQLHAYGGLWTDHIFAQIKLHVTAKGRSAIAQIDNQMSAMPCWSGLNHFDTVMNITFNDGSKNEDIAKMMLFATHNVLIDPVGVLILQVVRSFLELNMCSTKSNFHFTVILIIVQQYIEACKDTEYEEKSWNFPKMHSHSHVFDDINKGATCNFGTKISEAMHGPIRQIYHRLTNFKNVTPQLIKHDHHRAVSLFIREQLDILDDLEGTPDHDGKTVSNIIIGSKLKHVAFAVIEETMADDTAFERFRIRFADFLTQFLQAYGFGLPGSKPIKFDKNDTIEPFQYLKVYYQHLGNWTSTVNHLRCNPNFYGQARYDGALVKTTDGHIFVQLIYMFSCTIEGNSHPFALVLPLDTRLAVTRKDRLLRLYHLHAKPRKQAEFISAHSIV
ncbi:hypothetical protein B0H14DRAFT_3171311 [Mycena olivaceomarginata]|nr:hypothetical protein B0H14DRAFT_3171311 [Mycena olivaceomarginata]